MQNLIVHLNLAQQGQRSHCFLRTDLFGITDVLIIQHLMSELSTSSREGNRYNSGLKE